MAGEVDEVLGSRLPTAEDVGKLKYTRMVLSESMRLYPPAWTMGRQSQREMVLGGYRVPAKSTVQAPCILPSTLFCSGVTLMSSPSSLASGHLPRNRLGCSRAAIFVFSIPALRSPHKIPPRSSSYFGLAASTAHGSWVEVSSPRHFAALG